MAPQRQKLKLRVHKKTSCHPQTVKTYTRRVKQLSTSAVVNQPTTSLHVKQLPSINKALPHGMFLSLHEHVQLSHYFTL